MTKKDVQPSNYIDMEDSILMIIRGTLHTHKPHNKTINEL